MLYRRFIHILMLAGAAPWVAPLAAAADPEPVAGLQEIVVTAQRREEGVQHAALAVSAVSGEAVANAGVTDSSQLTTLVPALQISSVYGPTNTFYLRGVGNLTTNSLSDPAVAFNIDGVYLTRPTSVQGLFFDLDHVEVLKGPQGTLYGRNATGGVINVITAKPKIGDYSGYTELEFGNFSDKRLTGAINLPAGATGAVRIATQIVDRNGYYSDGTDDNKSQAVRLQYTVHPNDGVRLNLGLDYEHQGGEGAGATVVGLDASNHIGLFDPRAAAAYQSSFAFLAGNFLYPLQKDNYNGNKYWGVNAQADIDTAIGTVTVLPAYRHAQLDYRTYASGFAATSSETDQQGSLEARLVSSDNQRLSYILGTYLLHEKDDSYSAYDQQYTAFYTHFEPRLTSYAAFGRLNFHVTDELRLTGGVRYTIDKKSADMYSPQSIVICPSFAFSTPPGSGPPCIGGPNLPNSLLPPSFIFAPDGSVIPVEPYGTAGNIVSNSALSLSPSETYKKATYRGGIEYDVAPSSLLYFSYETGFKSGGFFVSIDNPTFQPETIDAFTLGSKNRFLNDRLQVNLELFHWNYKNQQVSHFRTNSAGGTEFVTENIGRTRIQGAELDAQARVLVNTVLESDIQFLDARDQDFTYRSPLNAGAPATGCPTSIDQTFTYFVVNCSGRRPTQSPEWTIGAGIEQTVPLGDAGSVKLSARTHYQSESYTGFELLPAQLQKAYTMTDLLATYLFPNDHFSVAAFVNNLEDTAAFGFSQPHSAAHSLIIGNLRPPRTYGIRLGAKF
jgi:iron complex outermembrane receptor protein